MAKPTTTLTRKDMEGPDRFQAATGQAVGWAVAHKRQLTAAAILVAAAIVAGAIGVNRQMAREERAGALLFKVFDAMDGEVSSVPLPGIGKPTFKSEEER